MLDADADALVLAAATCVLCHDGDELDEDDNASALVASRLVSLPDVAAG